MIAGEYFYWIVLAMAWILHFTKHVRPFFAGGNARKYALFFVAFARSRCFLVVSWKRLSAPKKRLRRIHSLPAGACS